MVKEIFGSLETVKLLDFDLEVLAKVDTGAWSGALHCTDVEERDGQLFFTPLGDDSHKTSVSDYETRQVRSASGHIDTRYIIPVAVEIKGKTYHTTVGLTDRNAMQREMLLGRKFLIENKILVDVSLTLEDDYEAEKYL